MPDSVRRRVELGRVSETLLWTLYFRALEARRPNPVLHDPWAVELVDAIDYPFAERFGAHRGLAQVQALRARRFDDEVTRFLRRHPDGTVVALGEGLETQFWRVDNGRVGWVSVDLPEPAELRRRLLPESARLRVVARSVLDEGWMDEVDPARRVLITAQGLLMYLQPDDVHRVISACAQRFPGGALVFDAVPRWFSARTIQGRMTTREGYQSPPMPWGMDPSERRQLRALHRNIVGVRDLRLPRGRGLVHGGLLPLVHLLPIVRAKRPTITRVQFGGAAPAGGR